MMLPLFLVDTGLGHLSFVAGLRRILGFDASRVKPIAGGTEFIKGNLAVAGDLVGGYLSRKRHSVEELAPGDAAILKINGHNVAAFRDDGGQAHLV